MPGVKRLRKIQYVQEATAGTGIATTAKWGGNGTLVDEGPIEFVDADIGNLIPDDESYRPYNEASISFDDVPATFETLPVLLSAGVENVTTGAADGSGSGKIYQYDFPTTVAPGAIKTWTIEAGNDQECDEVNYCFVEELNISGAKQEAVMVSATWRGRSLTDTSFTAGQSVATQEQILFQKGKVYIDDSAVGTATQKSNTLVAFEFGGPTGWQPIYAADGELYFSTIKNVGPELEGSFTFEHDTTGEAERGKAQSESVRYVRLEFQGSALSTAGTSYTYKTLRIDFACKYTEVPSLEDDDGNDQYTLPFRVTNDHDPQIIVVNEVANV